jgi:tRNA pseudouridine55 synthase
MTTLLLHGTLVKEKGPAMHGNRSTGVRDPRTGPDSESAMGLLVLNKPSGFTSRELVNQVARRFPGIKVGHAGTLDPLASGVLVVCLGAATRLVEELQHLRKSYRTVIRLGARSDTLDADGRIVEEARPRVPSACEVEVALQCFRGEVLQKPPDYSALKIKGRRAYKLARAGQSVELAPRLVRIDRIAPLSYTWPQLELEVDCGSGTFIRSIARDVGEELACGGLVESLIRTRIGPFTLEEALDPAQLTTRSIERHLRPASDAVPDLPRVVLDARQLEFVIHGRKLAAAELAGRAVSAGRLALLDQAGSLVALGEFDPESGCLQPRKVLV